MPSNLTEAECKHYLHVGRQSKPDADISGTGVVLAFILSAYITLAVVFVSYFAGLIEDGLLNDVDRRTFRIRPYRGARPMMFAALRKSVLIYGDQQIVTGIAIMAAGFQGLRDGEISVYHYQIVLYLAWMASSVHLSALTNLGTSLTRNKGLMVWRLLGMLVLLVLLIVALVPTTSNLWAGFGLNHPWSGYDKRGWGVPAKCFWDFRFEESVNADAPLGYILLIGSYLWKLGGLFEPVRGTYNHWLRFPIEQGIVNVLRFSASRCQQGRKWYWLLAFRLSLALMLPVYAILEMLASFAASLWVSVLGLVFGTIQVEIPRRQNQQFTASGEQNWGFGQLVPLILLVQPFGMLMEYVYPDEVDKAEIQVRYGPDSVVAQPRSDQIEVSESFAHRTLISCFEAVQPSSPSSREEERACIKDVLYSSWLFAALIWLIQIAIVVAGCLVFYLDAESIGNTSTSNWVFVLYAVVGFIGGSIVLGFVCTPFSRLGRLEQAESSRVSIETKKNRSQLFFRRTQKPGVNKSEGSTSPNTVEMNHWRSGSDAR